MTKILVTGALGNVGSAVAQSLVGTGPEVVVADRSLEALEERFADSCSVARLDFHDHDTFHCLEGVSGVFVLRPPQIARVGNTINRSSITPPNPALTTSSSLRLPGRSRIGSFFTTE